MDRQGLLTAPADGAVVVCETPFGALCKALRVERRLSILEVAVLACLPEDVVQANEVAGPLDPETPARILRGLHLHEPLTVDQIDQCAVFTDVRRLRPPEAPCP